MQEELTKEGVDPELTNLLDYLNSDGAIKLASASDEKSKLSDCFGNLVKRHEQRNRDRTICNACKVEQLCMTEIKAPIAAKLRQAYRSTLNGRTNKMADLPLCKDGDHPTKSVLDDAAKENLASSIGDGVKTSPNEGNFHAETRPPVPAKVAPVALPTIIPSTLVEGGHVPHSGSYAFPVDDPKFVVEYARVSGKPVKVLIDELRMLATKSGNTLGADKYIQHRMTACAISVALNERQRYPIALRPFWRNAAKPKGVIYTDAESLLANDQRMIDLHWLNYAGFRNGGEHWSHMFGDHFDFQVAAEFASTTKKAATKVIELGLAWNQMLPLGILLTSEAYERRKTISKQLRVARCLISDVTGRPKSRMPSSTDELLVVCQSLLYADGDIRLATKLFQQISGLDITGAVMRKRLQWAIDSGIVSLSKSGAPVTRTSPPSV